ncbi:GDP-mannose 4,6-dehydratase [Paenibacillus amylolyticus]|uniref:GDP-mannose 4,6-dehydratase n=1 Tax=Paenibacillus TaxID=44249 RepID=UPI0030DB89A7
MKKALITGISGFVGKYLAEELTNNGYEVWGGTRDMKSMDPHKLENLISIDQGNKQKIVEDLNRIKPTVIFHLSAQSSVARSWEDIEKTFEANLMRTIELMEAIRCSEIQNDVTFVSIGSSEEYGNVSKQPITEDTALNPSNPYGLSKATTEKILLFYHQLHNIKIVHVRPFNHIGPGQNLGFVTSDFAKQITDIEKELIPPLIEVGDLTARRDFTDVRDIVKGYRLVSEYGISGEAYNICSGRSVSIQNILDILLSFSSKEVDVVINSGKLRPVSIKEYYGDNGKLRSLTGWSPEISLDNSLRDIYNYWMDEV